MGERTLAQSAAAENWGYFKSQVRHWRSHPRVYAMWVADMRNAWVAYHAGAEWMNPWRETLQDNARLTAEVERWRVRTDDLRRLVSAKRIEAERAQRQLAEARAEVQRLRSASREYRRELATCRDRATGPEFCEAYDWCIGRLDALTREDGAE
jgi:hypothetical protein